MNNEGLPPHSIRICISERREPGMMVFNVRPGGPDIGRNKVGWILGVDQQGRIQMNLKFDTAAQDSCALPNGNLMFSLTGAGLIKKYFGQVRSCANGMLPGNGKIKRHQ